MSLLPLNRHLIALFLLAGSCATATAGGLTPALQLSERIDPMMSRAGASAMPAPDFELQLSADIGDSIVRELVLITGAKMLGTEYVFGGNSDQAVDCSSLVQRMFRSAGIELPRTSRELVRIGEPVAHDALAPGDLLFYRWGPSGLHVAVYLEDDRILHASSSQREVVVSALSPAWEQRLVAARRLL